jgi:tetratricopeptide (TPR) repeat protein
MVEDAYTTRLSDYLDDEDVSARERADIAAHLATCDACRRTLAELRVIQSRAASLPDAPSAMDGWAALADRIDVSSRVTPFARAPRRFSFTLPQLVAAGLALMVLTGGMVWMSRLGDPQAALPPVAAVEADPREDLPMLTNFADAHYDEAVSDLEKALESNRARLDPETIRVIEENLLSIDVAIAQSRKALRSDPANVYLNNHFADSRNRKLALLRRASALAMAQADGSGS